jgi:hypothetical protein
MAANEIYSLPDCQWCILSETKYIYLEHHTGSFTLRNQGHYNELGFWPGWEKQAAHINYGGEIFWRLTGNSSKL